jgi:hypothetical protein
VPGAVPGPGSASDPTGRPPAYGPDHTAEIPQVRLAWEPSSDGEPGYDNVETRARFVDETMELPIYEELESAWFRTKKPFHDEPPTPRTPIGQPAPNGMHGGQFGGQRGPTPPAPAAPSVPPSSYAPPVEVGYAPAGQPAQPGRPADPRWAGQPGGQPAGQPSAESAVSWHTAADEGWEAAAALANDQDFATTETGLPRRVPMSQLVPGGIDKTTTTATHRRTPESVRGLLSAYHRGVQRGRTRSDDPKTPEPTSAGPQNSQGGKEQEG